ncbi:MAG: 16S rRNA (uracil(1498)-N(3))-methyltransferase [Leadbetterella sp.]|nr:16S rRNA (uracil(1498)-N(3))-methyltransferase [Leadbetterella sp.]
MGSKIDFLFYSPDVEKTLALDPIESLHAIKVLRKRQGDLIQVTDGKGGWFSCEITRPDPKSCGLAIRSAGYDWQRPEREIYIAISPTKNSDRIEYFLEKSIEIGVSGVYFIKTQNTYPQKINLERLEKIAVSAMKQSLKAYKPALSGLISFPEFIKEAAVFPHKFLAHLNDSSEDIIDVPLADKMLVLIGPEGDFSKEELQIASENGFQTLTLGKSRLRTETAGVFAVSVLNARKYPHT